MVKENNCKSVPNGHGNDAVPDNNGKGIPNGRGNDAAPDDATGFAGILPLGNNSQTCHARFPHLNPLPEGEEANESLRELHVKVSICIPVRNGGTFLPLAVESVLVQSFHDFEIIIVDNASTDGTTAWAEEMAASNDKVRLFKNDHNIGLVGNFNACLKYAHGTYIKYLCADDLLMPLCLEKMTQALDDDLSVSLVAGGRQILNEAGEAIGLQYYSRAPAKFPGHEVINRCLFGANYIGEPSAVMFRRQDALRGFREELSHLMDLEMWFHLLEKGRMANLPEPLCAIRRHAAQMTVQSVKSGALVEDNVRLFKEYGSKAYIHESWVNDLGRRTHMAYRIWLCREHLDAARRDQLLKLYSIPVIYYFVMPVLARTLSRLRHTHLLKR